MAIRFVIGRAGTGKTSFCRREICDELQAKPLGDPLIWLVPEQGSFLAESAIVQQTGIRGSVRAEVLGFRRLAHRIMQQEQGSNKVYIDESGKRMLLHKTVRVVADQFRFYRSQTMSDGLLEQIGDLFEEWRRNGIDSEAFSEFIAGDGCTSEALADKLHDLQLLFRLYQAELTKLYLDAEDDLLLLARLAEQSEHIRKARIWVDGFHGFTPLEMRVLTQLLLHAAEVTVTLCLDRTYEAGEALDEMNLFFRTASTYQELGAICRRFALEAERILLVNQNPPTALAHLEAAFDQLPSRTFSGEPTGLELYAATNRRVEVESVALEMRRLVRDHGYRWRELAIMVRDQTIYLPHIQSIFRKYEIPFFTDQTRSIADHPLIEFVSASLQTVTRFWRYEDLFRAIKTGFFLPIASEEERRHNQAAFDSLENLVIAAGLERGRWLKDELWSEPLRLNGSKLDNKIWHAIKRARTKVLEPMQQLQRGLQQATNVREAVQVIYHYLVELKVPETCAHIGQRLQDAGELEAAAAEVSIWSNLIHLFDQNVEILGNEPFHAASWIQTFDRGLSALKVGFVPPAIDQVIVGAMDRTRMGPVQVLFVLGANEGILPAKIADRGLLTDSERDLLIAEQISVSPGSWRKMMDESFLIYTTVSLARRRLWVSYAQGDDAGKGLTPSLFVTRLKSLFPALKERTLSLDYHLLTNDELRHVLQHPRQATEVWALTGRDAPGLEASLRFQDGIAAELDTLLRARAYRNEATALSIESAKTLYGEQLHGSVSRFELFSSCGFAHFARYGLRLRERASFEVDALQVGILYHAVLEHVLSKCQEESVKLSSYSQDEIIAMIEQSVESSVGKLHYAILSSSPEHQYTLEKLRLTLQSTILGMASHERNSLFEVHAVEWAFDISLDSMRLEGRVDRIDIATDEDGRRWLRIIDFKSGQKTIDFDSMVHGLKLQLPLYLDIALTEADESLEQLQPAGMFYFQIHDRVESKPHPLTDEEERKQTRVKYKMSGVMTDQISILQMMDHELQVAPSASALLPVRITKDGNVHSGDLKHLLSAEQWQHLRAFVRQKMRHIGATIMSGDTSIRPYKLNKQIPCTYCEFRPVCQFDPTLEGQRYRHLQKVGRDTVLQQMSDSLS